MGKSPAKWIKSVLLGKKAPKQKVAQGKERAANDREVLVAAKATERDLATATIASHLSEADRIQENLELENTGDETSPQDATFLVIEHEVALLSDALDAPERREQDQAATKVQASFRGYLARRAYLALKGIIRLQALIRGHLVRRQAASTIHCMLGIVKLQAHVRGKRVRLSDIGLEVQGKVILETIWGSKPVNTREGNCIRAKNLFTNAFGLKFFALSPGPLCIQYDSIDPNSATSWLDRWSASHFWKPAPVSRKPNGSTPLDQNQSPQDVKTETNRAKRNNKVSSGRVDSGSTRSSSEVERSRRTFRKPLSYSIEVSDPEAARSELERVKRSLRKVHESIPSAVEEDKLKQNVENTSAVSGQDVPEQTKIIAPEKLTEDPYETMPTLVDVDTSPEQPKMYGASDFLPNNETNVVDIKSMDTVGEYENIPIENEGSCVKQDALDNENRKASVKGSSPAKHESVQNGSNKQPKVPSYMAATKSAKAKMRDQDLLVFEQEALEKTPTSARRHSLPSATGTKVSSSRIQKLNQLSDKGKNKSAKPLSAPKDATGKADWRR